MEEARLEAVAPPAVAADAGEADDWGKVLEDGAAAEPPPPADEASSSLPSDSQGRFLVSLVFLEARF